MKQVGEYQITHTNIAKGAFASIHKGKHIYSDYIVAIKEIKLNGEPIKNYIKREIEIHRSLDHPNIVRVLDVIYDTTTSQPSQHPQHTQHPQHPQHPQPSRPSHNTSIYIIMEYCTYGDLQKFQNKKPFSHKHIQYYMLQLRDALQYLRTKNIVHRDLKPQNILLTSSLNIKITDFGLARYINLETKSELHTPPEYEDLFSTYCGSPIYMSPELLNHQHYNSKSDLWSLGIILYELITGVPPFIAKNLKHLVHRVNTEKINLDKIDRTLISDDCFNLLRNLLNHDKAKRVDWDDFFSHKWFANNIILEEENRLIENPLCYDLIDCGNIARITSAIHPTPTIHPTPSATDPDIIKSTSSSSSGLKFSDHLNSLLTNPPVLGNIQSTNSPKLERRHTSIDKSFTFSLKSSRIAEELQLKNPPDRTNQINLSDLVQDDIAIGTTSPYNTPNSKVVSKPINIVGRNRYLRTPPSSDSSSSTSMPSHINNNLAGGNSAPTRSFARTDNNNNNNTSPRGIMNAIRFIKETYDYLNSDNKSL